MAHLRSGNSLGSVVHSTYDRAGEQMKFDWSVDECDSVELR